ncbi:MAG TPA: VCBS repeat-containing protein [Usitatibacter sp.]|nr:VCBS repeat-containing protein [Usitatibacter sp.]
MVSGQEDEAPKRSGAGTVTLGVLLVLAGLALNKWSLEKLFSPDEHISSRFSIAVIAVFDMALLAAGLWLALRRPRLPVPAFARHGFSVLVAAAVLLGAYGSLRATGIADPYRETRTEWTKMAEGEELIFQITPQFKILSASLNNLRLPDPPSQSIFEPQVKVVDIVPVAGPEGMHKVSDTGIETPDWKLAPESTQPAANLQLWRAFIDRVDYVNFPWTEFKAVKARFLDDTHDRFEMNLAFQGVGRLKTGGWIWVKALNEVRWQKAPGSDPNSPNAWKIYEWRTTKFNTWERNELLFGEVMDEVVPPEVAARAKRSIHEEMRVAYLQDKEKKEPHPHFTLEAVDRHPGVAVVDLDGDGFDDIYLLSDYGKNLFFHNKGDGTFEEIGAKLGLDLDGHSSSAIFADFDNDGHLDVIIGRTLSRSVYMHWENGKFVDRSDWIAGGLPFLVSSVSAVDYDGDGLLDVYLSTYATNIAYWEHGRFDAEAIMPYLPKEQVERLKDVMAKIDNPFTNLAGPPNVLLHNVGHGHFEPVRDSALAVYKNTYQATWSDYDGDGKPDVFLANDFSPPMLFHNLGAGKFEEVTAQEGVTEPRFGMGVTWGDYDGDGRPDLYMAAMSSKAGRRILSQLPDADPRFAVMAAGNALYHNEPGKLVKTSGASAPKIAVEQSGWDYGSQLVDLNNDGWLDIFSLSGYYSAPKQFETDFDL